MDRINSISKESLFKELECHKTEYVAMRQELRMWHLVSRRYQQITVLAIIAGIGAFPFVVEQDAEILYLLFPFAIYVIIQQVQFAQYCVGRFTDYLGDVLTPRVNEVMSLIDPVHDSFRILGFQDYWNELPNMKSGSVQNVQFLGITVFLGAYLLALYIKGFAYNNIYELVLLGLHIVVLLVVVIRYSMWNILRRRSLKKQSKTNILNYPGTP